MWSLIIVIATVGADGTATKTQVGVDMESYTACVQAIEYSVTQVSPSGGAVVMYCRNEGDNNG